MDVNLTYRLPAMAWGNVTAGLNRTYLTHCDVLPDTTDPSSVTIHNVGRYTQPTATSRAGAHWAR